MRSAPMDPVDIDGEKRPSEEASNESFPLVSPTMVTRKGQAASKGGSSSKGQAAQGGSSSPRTSNEMSTTGPMDSVDKSGQKRPSKEASNESSPLVPPTKTTRMVQAAKGGSSAEMLTTSAMDSVDISEQKRLSMELSSNEESPPDMGEATKVGDAPLCSPDVVITSTAQQINIGAADSDAVMDTALPVNITDSVADTECVKESSGVTTKPTPSSSDKSVAERVASMFDEFEDADHYDPPFTIFDRFIPLKQWNADSEMLPPTIFPFNGERHKRQVKDDFDWLRP